MKHPHLPSTLEAMGLLTTRTEAQRRGVVYSFLRLLGLILPGLTTRGKCEAAAADSVTALLYPLSAPSVGPVGFEQSPA